MAVTDDCPLYPSDSLILKKGRKHYRTPVRAQHWQLRSLISAEKKSIVYFPGGNASRCLQRLNTRTHECETLVKLLFAPRCLTAAHGWLCCGSEHGDFVAVKLEIDDDDDQAPLEVDPDARLPLGLGLDAATESAENLMSRARPLDRHLPARTAKMAKNRVNCITLWAPSLHVPTYPGAYSTAVAVLANNDRTVTIVDLEAFDEDDQAGSLAILKYPDYVNRALISPDGRYLVAILDDPYLYIHERTTKPSHTRLAQPGHEWQLSQRVLLKSQKKEDATDSRGSFAACFSPSGLYLAVGTQHGTISIFDTSLLTSDSADPLITTFQSSQPKTGPGAVRDMAFCPGPYDLLAWTEDRRHIGIADIRSDFVIRQILDISIEQNFEHVNTLERNTIDPRLLHRRDDEVNGTGIRHQRRQIERLEALNRPLTAEEMAVLEAMRGDRRRRERMALLLGNDSVLRPSSTSRAAAHQDTDSSSGPRDQASGIRSPGSSLLERARSTRGQISARSPRGPYRTQADPTTVSLMNAERSRWTERLADMSTSMRHDVDDHANRTVIEILHARDLVAQTRATAEPGGNEYDNPNLVTFASYINANESGSRWEESALRNTLPDHGVFDAPPSPDNTAGLSWSEDGRRLFVGAQNGIYEFQVDVQGRKQRSGVNWR